MNADDAKRPHWSFARAMNCAHAYTLQERMLIAYAFRWKLAQTGEESWAQLLADLIATSIRWGCLSKRQPTKDE